MPIFTPTPPDLLAEVDRLLAQGLSGRAVAARVGLGARTVHRYMLKKQADSRFANREQVRVDPPKGTDRAELPSIVNQVEVKRRDDGSLHVAVIDVDCIRSEQELLDAAKVDLTRHVITHSGHRAWTQLGPEGRVFQMHHVSLTLQPTLEGLYRKARDIRDMPPMYATPPLHRGTVAFIPDTQVGFIWDARHEYLEPLHDRKAMDVAWHLVAAEQPEQIYLLGDMLDLASLSIKYTRPPSYNQTVQPAIDEMYWWLKRLRAMCPNSRIIYQVGNHEDRIGRLMNDRAGELSSIRQAGSEQPVLSVRHLLRLDELGIECVEVFGDGTWLWRDEADTPVWVHHGDVVRGGEGKTSKTVAARGRYHSVFGHVHRNECYSTTVHGPSGYYHVHTLTPGCLCRVDGRVPGVTMQPDWQQGVGFMTLINRTVHKELVDIQDGIGVRGGMLYGGADPQYDIAQDTGWPQMIR